MKERDPAHARIWIFRLAGFVPESPLPQSSHGTVATAVQWAWTQLDQRFSVPSRSVTLVFGKSVTRMDAVPGSHDPVP